jgi:Gamma-glutamyltranspeptidase
LRLAIGSQIRLYTGGSPQVTRSSTKAVPLPSRRKRDPATISDSCCTVRVSLMPAPSAARFRHNQVPNKLDMESELYKIVGTELARMGHKVSSINGGQVGGYQSIMFVPDKSAPGAASAGGLGGYYRAGSDHRKDGQAVGW